MKYRYIFLNMNIYRFQTKIYSIYKSCMTLCGHSEYSTTCANLWEELDLVVDE